MNVTLTKDLEAYVFEKVNSGRYADASDVVRDALRALELRDNGELPQLEAEVLEGIKGPHQPYNFEYLNRICTTDQSLR